MRCLLTLPEGKQKRTLKWQRRSIVEMIIALQEQLDSDEIVKLLIKYDRVGCIFLSIDDKRFDKNLQHQFIIDVFRYALTREQLAIACRMIIDYE